MRGQLVFAAMVISCIFWPVCRLSADDTSNSRPAWLLQCTVRVEHSFPEKDAYGQDCRRHQVGTGVVVMKADRKFYVLTCAHNFKDGSRYAFGTIRVRLTRPANKNSDKQIDMKASMVYYDAAMDMALLCVSGQPDGVAVLADEENYKNRQAVIKCGYPNFVLSIRRGTMLVEPATIVEGKRRFSSSRTLLPASPGDSGCGVFRESDRKLIGILWGGRKEDGISMSHRLPDIRIFLKQAAAKDRAVAVLAR